ncbi:MAG: hypothetical protein HYR90_00855 [Candidatus Andersenbacteria bacterium]|nr:hypothetical protein [Candidatus Andersenbacteria bacterium]MBI3251202.1 hypothetical protein [Candidatus Andersenbacteria bacterium]
MSDESLPPFVGESALSPIRLTEEQEDLCQRLDDWHGLDGLKVKPSEMFRGAVYAMRQECKSNPDRLAQAANSLREILYPFQSPQVKNVSEKQEKAFKKYGSVRVDEEFFKKSVKPLYEDLNDVAHHGVAAKRIDFLTITDAELVKLLADFEKIMLAALARQLDVHQEIDEFLTAGPDQVGTHN